MLMYGLYLAQKASLLFLLSNNILQNRRSFLFYFILQFASWKDAKHVRYIVKSECRKKDKSILGN